MPPAPPQSSWPSRQPEYEFQERVDDPADPDQDRRRRGPCHPGGRLGGGGMFCAGPGRTGAPRALQYQGIIDESTRNCVVSDGLIGVNMGVSGRVLLGPAGKQTTVNAPIRFAVERDGQAVFSEK